jgi:hypothetical protein
MLLHRATIWLTGNSGNGAWGGAVTLDADDRDALDSYLNAGGRLYFSSQFAGQEATGWTQPWASWFEGHFRANMVNSWWGQSDHVGAAGSAIGDGLDLTSGYDGVGSDSCPALDGVVNTFGLLPGAASRSSGAAQGSCTLASTSPT